MNYDDFVSRKLTRAIPTGLEVVPPLHEGLFPHQRDLVAWALRRGRAAIFAATGLGKSRMQLEWARHVHGHTGRPVIVLAPLAVAAQTVDEGRSIGVAVRLCREAVDVGPGINVTNYDRLHRFDASQFGAVVLDESSIIKHHDAKTLKQMLDAFASTPFKLCASATPAPNDYTELGTHAEFLGVCTRTEMLSEFFCHDGGETQVWRLKGHARKQFWSFVASWGAMLRRPSDLGYDDGAYALPDLEVHHHRIAADVETVKASGMLFAEEAKSLSERRNARRASIADRVRALVDTIAAEPGERWVIWCELNAEQDAIADALGDECVSVYGALDADEKEKRIDAFVHGGTRILLGKPSIFGFGLNLQMAARVAFVGVTDSWESYHQAIRRCWRFGQTRPVHVHVFASELEGEVVRNLERKERDAARMGDELSAETRDIVRLEVRGQERVVNEYAPASVMRVPEWIVSEEGFAG